MTRFLESLGEYCKKTVSKRNQEVDDTRFALNASLENNYVVVFSIWTLESSNYIEIE